MSSEIISNLEILETSESKTFDEGFVSLQSPTPLEWVTLVFPNYSEKPVEQRWSKTTLSVIPYFAKLFSFPSPKSADRIVLEWDPKVFVEIIDSIRCQEKTHIEAFSEFLGLEIRKGVPKKPKKTYYCLLIKKGRQFIKVDISNTPSISNTTKELFESKGFNCRFFIHQSVNYPLNSLLRKINNHGKNY